MDRELVSKKLIELRGDKTQKQVAAALGIAQSTYAMYESGSRMPSDNVKIILAKYYKKSVQSIFFSG